MTTRNGEPFRQWMLRESEIWPGLLKGAEAAIEALLPVAFGTRHPKRDPLQPKRIMLDRSRTVSMRRN